ncbi:type III-B CRISPR module RAMP protein Cmr1 [Kutzneria buriramensis]|uniref:CRISPR-associated protein Cmr1 n=1 Tax=Kutzneria buriramensis TaxID=1045776 RepID=A0A3E0HLN1_9PSEU|nr:type III-B CRISPR module RAMP protein Cmr1 [Kutzneria buriramensis]REH47341.1 CRISPR-associated protein Cmr1 [Kutzneria buriramensis]
MTTWTTLTLRVVTPLFSGDDAEGGDPIRVPSIRGALRFWFRAVAAAHGITDLKALWAEEEAVFGSARPERPSRIALRVDSQPATDTDPRPEWAAYPDLRDQRFHGAQYLMGQGLWQRTMKRPYVPPGPDQTFDLKIRFATGRDAEKLNARFMLALWAWLTYGGLGARVRRGFGQLRCADHSGVPLPGKWRHEALGAPTRAESWGVLFTQPIPPAISRMGEHGWTGRPGNVLAEFPVLCPPHWEGRFLAGEALPDWQSALMHAGQEWRAFRVVAEPEEEISKNLRSPEWVNAIHGSSGKYPIAAFGLPVGYYSTSRGEFRASIEPTFQGAKIRRASPVWLRPVWTTDGWRVVTFLFHARLLPDTARLSPGKFGLTIPDLHTISDTWRRWLTDEWRLPEDFYRGQS